MEHYYHTIEGWFDYPEVYILAVEKAPDKGIFVEVGTWVGRSLVFLATTVINSNKDIIVYGIDDFSGSPGEISIFNAKSFPLQRVESDGSEKIKEEFLKNIEPVFAVVRPIFKKSVDVATMFDDESIDFCFIDSDHSYESIKKEIDTWYPKIKPGGMIGGHDLQLEPVARAVTEKFGGNFILDNQPSVVKEVFPENNNFHIHYGSPNMSWYHFKN